MPKYTLLKQAFIDGSLVGPNTNTPIIHKDDYINPCPEWMVLVDELNQESDDSKSKERKEKKPKEVKVDFTQVNAASKVVPI